MYAQDHRIHMSDSDFVDMTSNGALCNAAGEIGAREFETIMRGEVTTYLQVVIRAGSWPERGGRGWECLPCSGHDLAPRGKQAVLFGPV